MVPLGLLESHLVNKSFHGPLEIPYMGGTPPKTECIYKKLYNYSYIF